MSAATAGLLAGMALGFAAYFGGFWAFLLVAVLGLAGLAAGRMVQGDLRMSDFTGPRDRMSDFAGRRDRR
ncbi:hypothetical protein [Streptomyces sp. NPDC007369]|uniref:hypothetical protein n=1 Tax=Streptomyces sp. NPDC007369 TaxID=3154589 RepID=UPI00340986E2